MIVIWKGKKQQKKPTMGEMGFKCDRRPLHSIMDLKTWSFYFWLKIPSLSAPSPQAVDWWLHLSNMTSKHPRLAAGSKLENDRLEHKEVESQLVEFIALQYSAEDKGPKLRSTSTWSFWGQTKMKLGIKGKHHPLPFYKLHWQNAKNIYYIKLLFYLDCNLCGSWKVNHRAK